jgi:hypothetical protein
MEQQNYTMVIYNGMYLAVQKDALEDVDSWLWIYAYW